MSQEMINNEQERPLSEILQIRRDKLAALQAEGRDPFLITKFDFDSDSAQYKWLVGDLKKVDRVKTPWIVVLVHAPWYNSNTAHQDEAESTGMKAAMEDLLYQARVDVVFAGHVHAYERFVSFTLLLSSHLHSTSISPCQLLITHKKTTVTPLDFSRT